LKTENSDLYLSMKSYFNSPKYVFVGLLTVLLLLAGCTFLQQESAENHCITTGWPHESSDLTPDPALVFGRLDNGLRYVIMPNHEPVNRVGLYLDVQSGSMNETDHQRGLAHYLEHMLFNGTVHYPPGTLVEYFQSIGLGFGADTNAHTGYDETVYKLLLPNSDRKTLETGLVVMADYARGALLLENEVDRERGIILAEKRARDSARSRIFQERMRFVFAGTRIAERNPIGTEQTLQNADSVLLREYYDRWYRPENIILVVVGDVEPKIISKLVEKNLATLSAADSVVNCPDPGKVVEQGTAAFYRHEPELGYTNVTIESVWNTSPVADTRAYEARSLAEYMASLIMNNRLKHLVDEKDSPMTRANFYTGKVVKLYGNTSLVGRTSAENWKKTLTLLEKTRHQALTYGFTGKELSRARNELLTMLKKQLQKADSRDSRKLADDLIYKLNNNELMLSPAQELALYEPMVEKMTLDQVNKAFQRLWHPRRVVEVTGTAMPGKDKQSAEAALLQGYSAAAREAVAPWPEGDNAVFPYLPEPATATAVIDHAVYQEIGVERYTFANGMVLNLKHTDFAPNEINVVLLFGNGRLTEPLPGLGYFAQGVIEESGVGRLSKDQLAASLASCTSRVKFIVDEDSFLLHGKGLSAESEILFQLLATRLHDPAFRKSAYVRAKEQMAQMYGQMETTAEGVMQLEGERFLAGNSPRYGFVPFSQVQQFTLEQIKNWLAPVFADAGLEISVVGDFDKKQIVELVSKYFSEQRAADTPLTGERIIFPTGKTLQTSVNSDSDRAMITVAWLTEDFWNISRTRRLSVLASVLEDRLRKQIREELGATYSPVVYNSPSRVDPGYGVLRSQMIVAPDQAAMLTQKLLEAGRDFTEHKVTEEELNRALKPVLTSIHDMVRTNRYWMQSVLTGSTRHPQQFEWPITILPDFASITSNEIQRLAARYLQPNNAARIVIVPKQ
jgi:zinc protease